MFTIGADIEAFVSDPDDGIVGALDVFPFTKEGPYTSDGWSIHADNVCIEVATPVATTKETWIEYVNSVPDVMVKYTGRPPLFVPTHHTPQHILSRAYYHISGCSASLNVFTGDTISPPMLPWNYRCAGGHIHIGSKKIRNMVSTQLQSFVWGLTETLAEYIDINNQLEVKRRFVYGQIGEIRLKPYGLEFRSLSPVWVTIPGAAADIYDRINEVLTYA